MIYYLCCWYRYIWGISLRIFICPLKKWFLKSFSALPLLYWNINICVIWFVTLCEWSPTALNFCAVPYRYDPNWFSPKSPLNTPQNPPPLPPSLHKHRPVIWVSLVSLNPLLIFSRNRNMYLQFLSFLYTDMTQVDKILSHRRHVPTYFASSIMGADNFYSQQFQINFSCIKFASSWFKS